MLGGQYGLNVGFVLLSPVTSQINALSAGRVSSQLDYAFVDHALDRRVHRLLRRESELAQLLLREPIFVDERVHDIEGAIRESHAPRGLTIQLVSLAIEIIDGADCLHDLAFLVERGVFVERDLVGVHGLSVPQNAIGLISD